KANDEKIEPQKVGERLRKVLTKGEVDQVVQTFNSPDVENLPPGNTTWRLSNALSWVAGKLTDAERKLDLMKLAGSGVKVAYSAVGPTGRPAQVGRPMELANEFANISFRQSDHDRLVANRPQRVLRSCVTMDPPRLTRPRS